MDVWFDRESLYGGDDWKREIRQAIREAEVFLLLLSQHSTTKAGYVQREIREAIEVLQTLPEGRPFIVPVRIEECEPHFEALESLHYIDLFPGWDDGVARLRQTFARRFRPDEPEPQPQPEKLLARLGLRAPAQARIMKRVERIIGKADLGPYHYMLNVLIREYGDWNLSEVPVSAHFRSRQEGDPVHLLEVFVDDGEGSPSRQALQLRTAVDMEVVSTPEDVHGIFLVVVPDERGAPDEDDLRTDRMSYREILDGRGEAVVVAERDLEAALLRCLPR